MYRQDFTFTLTDEPSCYATFAALADGTYERDLGTIYITQTKDEIAPSSSIINVIMPTVNEVSTGCTYDDYSASTVIEYETVAVADATVTTRVDSFVTVGSAYTEGGNTYNTVSTQDNFQFFPDAGTYDITTTVTIQG